MKVFLDTNILMDWYQKDRPGNALAKAVISASGEETYELVVSTQSIIDSAYSLRKTGVEYDAFAEMLRVLRTRVHIVGIDEIDLLWAMDNYTGDFEDDMQYASAYNAVCDFFITRDKKLLQHNSELCPMTVISPEDFVSQMMS